MKQFGVALALLAVLTLSSTLFGQDYSVGSIPDSGRSSSRAFAIDGVDR